ncbi:hypothetical protein OIU79_022206, partial [Salix purpurea]
MIGGGGRKGEMVACLALTESMRGESRRGWDCEGKEDPSSPIVRSSPPPLHVLCFSRPTVSNPNTLTRLLLTSFFFVSKIISVMIQYFP